MHALLHRAIAGFEHLLGATVAASLAMAMLSAWPLATQAAEPPEKVVNRGSQLQPRTVPDFQAIRLTGSIDLRVRQADSATLVVHAATALAEQVETHVDADKTLHIGWKRGLSLRIHSPVIVEVTAPMVRAVRTEGSGDVRVDGLTGPQLTLATAGSGDIAAMGLATDDLVLTITGSGDVRLSGRTVRLRVSINGSGDLRALDLKADDVTANLSGSGDADVQAARQLQVAIAGSGDLTYVGSPAVTQAVAGSGSVRKR